MRVEELYQKFLRHPVATDTRKIVTGSLFFALKGENFDAHQFASEALQKGATYVIIDNTDYYKKEDKRYILVPNVLKSLQELAHYHRKQLGIPIIALTGSNGKTTTKELLYAVLSKKYITYATQGNLNNHIGVPLTLLSMTKNTEIGIIEMGANHFGEIASLCEIAAPDYGYITNFGKAHLEGFGSVEGVVRAKSELYNYLKQNKEMAFVNSSDKKQMQLTRNQKRHLIGENMRLLKNKGFVKVRLGEMEIESQLAGTYNYSNIVASIGIGRYFKVPDIDISSAIASYQPKNQRSQLLTKGTTQILLDAYNANPSSMEAALKNFREMPAKRKIAILGDMFELGKNAATEHQKITNLAERCNFEGLILIGGNFFKVNTHKAIKFREYEVFVNSFDKASYRNTSVLIKGSRGMALERIVNLFD